MPTQLQFRRGNTAQTAAFTGALAEVTVDVEKHVVVVHDGETQGGFPAPTVSFVQSAFNAANTAQTSGGAAAGTAADAYDRANSAYSKANASYDAANTKVSKSGDTITGSLIVTDNLTANVIVANHQFYSGLATQQATPLPNLIAQFTSNSSSYVQVNAQNIDPYGSADFVVTADVGTDTEYFIDMGITNSLYALEEFPFHGLDGYLVVQGSEGQLGGNLVIGTSTSATKVNIIAGGNTDAHIAATFDSDANTTLHGYVLPHQGNMFDLGEESRPWHSLWLGPGSLNIGSIRLSQNTTTNALVISGATDIVLTSANGSFTQQVANVSNIANAAYAHANSAYIEANAAYAFAQGSMNVANVSGIYANGAWRHANSAYDLANNALNRTTGGTVTGDVTITGNLIINGETTTVNTTTVSTTDSLIKLANNNIAGDSLDIGFYGTYNDGSQRYTGLIKQAGGNYFLFNKLTDDPSSNILTPGSLTAANTATLTANIVSYNVSINGVNVETRLQSAFDSANSRVLKAGDTMTGVLYISDTTVSTSNTTGALKVAGGIGVTGSVYADAVYDSGRRVLTVADAAFESGNSGSAAAAVASAYANLAFDKANSAYDKANSAGTFANSAFDQANSAASFANGAFTKANSANITAQAAFDKANSGILTTKDEGTTLSTSTQSMNFIGGGVIATSVENDVTVNVKSIYDYTLDPYRFVITDGSGVITTSNSELEITPSHVSFNVRSEYVIGAGMNGEYYQSWKKADGTQVWDVGVYNVGYVGHQYSTMELYGTGATTNTVATFNSTGNVTIYGKTGSYQDVGLGTNYDQGRTLFVNGDLDARDIIINPTNGTGITFKDLTFQNTAAYPIVVKEEGTTIANTAKTLNFVGDAVTATASGNDVTITINTNSADAAFDKANAAFDEANASFIQANSAFDASNSAADFANGAFSHANAAYGKANTSVQTSGDNTINGSLTISNVGGTGLTVTGNVFFNNDLTVSGNLTIQGNTTAISANNLVLDDSIIYLANNNSSNTVDIGLVGHFVSDKYQHTGMVRDHTDATWKFFSNVTTEPSTTIDFTNALYEPIKVGSVIFNTNSTQESKSNTTSSTSQTTVYSFNKSQYRTAKIIAQLTSGTSYHAIELILIHDGTTVYLSQYGEVTSGTSLGTFDATISGSDVLLQLTPVNSSTTVKVASTLISV